MVENILVERARWTSTALGQRVALTFDVKIRLGIKTIACIDRSKRMVEEYYLRQRRERDRRRAARRRLMNKAEKLSPRAQRLFALLDDGWQDTAALIGRFAGRREGTLKYDTLRRAVMRAANELCDQGKAEQRSEKPQRRGRPAILVRRSAAKSGLSANRYVGNADEIRAARKGDAKLSDNPNIGQKTVASPKKCNENGRNFSRECVENQSPPTNSLYDDPTEQVASPQEAVRGGTSIQAGATGFKLN